MGWYRTGLVALLSLLIGMPQAYAEKKIPYKGRVTGSRINVRGGSGTTHGVLTQVNLGDDLDVIDEENGWCKVKLPHGISTWLYAKLLKDGKVNRDIVNVRSGPAVNYSILTTLKRGDFVDILEDHGDWVKIKPPSDTGGWIYGKYIRYLCPIEDYDQWLVKEKEGKAEFEKLETFRKKELFKSIDYVNFNLIISKYEAFIEKYKDLPEASIAKEIVLDTKAKKEVAIKNNPYREEKPAPQVTATAIETRSFKGILKKVKNQQSLSSAMSTATHYIRSPGFFGGKKCFLQSSNLDLSEYEGKNVSVFGEILVSKRVPLISVTKISLE